MTDELERRREECLQLRAMLAEKSITTHAIAKQSYGGKEVIVNEDDELATAYRSEKEINRSVLFTIFTTCTVYQEFFASLRKRRLEDVLNFHRVLFLLFKGLSMKIYSRVYFSLCLFLAISRRLRTQRKLNQHEKIPIYGIIQAIWTFVDYKINVY